MVTIQVGVSTLDSRLQGRESRVLTIILGLDIIYSVSSTSMHSSKVQPIALAKPLKRLSSTFGMLIVNGVVSDCNVVVVMLKVKDAREYGFRRKNTKKNDFSKFFWVKNAIPPPL